MLCKPSREEPDDIAMPTFKQPDNTFCKFFLNFISVVKIDPSAYNLEYETLDKFLRTIKIETESGKPLYISKQLSFDDIR